ncbi:FCPA [Symbiodinium sp. CCMP2592]|nr:FCPA [Symbiodinium sp. CCMP2592]
MPPANSAFDEAVRLLGVWLQWDGKHDRDTKEHLAAASKLWGKLSRQLGRLGLTVKDKGVVVKATVVNCFLFGCQRRTFSSRQLADYQQLLNRITFAICSQYRRTMSDDQVTLADLRKKCGLLPVRHMIEYRQLQYLGHLARLPESRLERQFLWAAMWPESELKSFRTGTLLRHTYWRVLQQVLAFSDLSKDQWASSWTNLAVKQDGTVWRGLLKRWHQAKMQKESGYEWKNKHSAEGLTAARRAAAAERARFSTGALLQPTGKYLCPHPECGVQMHLRSFRLHIPACAKLTEAARRTRAVQREQRERRVAERAPQPVRRRPAAAPLAAQAPEGPTSRDLQKKFGLSDGLNKKKFINVAKLFKSERGRCPQLICQLLDVVAQTLQILKRQHQMLQAHEMLPSNDV